MADIIISRAVTLADVPAREWDALAASARLYQTHGWLSWTEQYYGLPARYVLAREATGRLVGAVATYLREDVPNRLLSWYDPVRMFLAPYCGPSQSWHDWYPVLLIGGCGGYDSGILLSPCLDDAGRQAVARALLAECRAIAAAQGAGSLAFMYAPKPACEAVGAALGVPSRLIVTSADTVIPLDAGVSDFAGYVARFAKKRRYNVRKETEFFAAAGGRIAEYPLRDVLGQIAPLLGAHQRKYGDVITDEEATRYLELQDKYLGPASVVFADERPGGLVSGYSLCYAHGDTVYCRSAGFDPDDPAPFAYFNLAIYAPVRYATAHGLSAVALGLGSYEAKTLRGARLVPLWSVVVPPDPPDPAWADVLGRPSPQAVEAGCA